MPIGCVPEHEEHSMEERAAAAAQLQASGPSTAAETVLQQQAASVSFGVHVTAAVCVANDFGSLQALSRPGDARHTKQSLGA